MFAFRVSYQLLKLTRNRHLVGQMSFRIKTELRLKKPIEFGGLKPMLRAEWIWYVQYLRLKHIDICNTANLIAFGWQSRFHVQFTSKFLHFFPNVKGETKFSNYKNNRSEFSTRKFSISSFRKKNICFRNEELLRQRFNFTAHL